MVTLSFSVAPKNGSIKLQGFALGLEGRIIDGMQKAGAILEREMKELLSGPSHVRFPFVHNPYPGVLTGRLRQGVNFKVKKTSGGPLLVVGPKSNYAIYLETKQGAGRYPFVLPTWERKHQPAIRAIQDAIIKPLDK